LVTTANPMQCSPNCGLFVMNLLRKDDRDVTETSSMQ
jgi:hypothetical protein